MMKKVMPLFLCLVMMFAFPFGVLADGWGKETSATYVTYLEDDITVVTTVSWSETTARATRYGTASSNYYSGGTYIGNVVLYGNFYYDGTTSYVVNTGGSASTASGWTYSGQSTWGSGRTAYLQASLSNGSKTVPVSLSLTCDANGNLS